MYPAANIGALLLNIVGGNAHIAPPGAGHAAPHAGAAWPAYGKDLYWLEKANLQSEKKRITAL